MQGLFTQKSLAESHFQSKIYQNANNSEVNTIRQSDISASEDLVSEIFVIRTIYYPKYFTVR